MKRRFKIELMLALSVLLAACNDKPSQTVEKQPPKEPKSNGIVISLEPIAEKAIKDEHSVAYVVTNRSDVAQHILDWTLATNGVWDDLFDVRDAAGNELPYVGPIAKRGAPTDQDFLSIPAGESHSVVVELSAYYDMTSPGSYTVKLRDVPVELRANLTPLAEKSGVTVTFDKKEVSITAEVVAKPPDLMDMPPEKDREQYANCDTAQTSHIKTAQSNAQTMDEVAKKDLADHNAGSPSQHYTDWFGVSSPQRYALVTTHFDAIDKAIDGKLMFECKPTRCSSSSIFAYVVPSDKSHTVNFCDAFWNAGQSGDDSKPGTIIHEVSHFDDVADTDDQKLYYGKAKSRELALNDPDLAVHTADNHEYFAESQ